ncbi:MAG: MarR family transcriptional regulator [Gemmatimonadales bacterium]|nr:MAG: MarR family transcriptional regulator [Gemmatimonadales bacterium]
MGPGSGEGTPSSAPGTAEGAGGMEDPEVQRALRLWIVLARSYLTFSRAVSGNISEFGLTTAQFGVLEALHHLGPLSLGELAEKLLVTGGNITYVMDRLEDQGLVVRERSDRDRRVILAHLTHEGSTLMDRVFPEHADFIRRRLTHLEPAEQDELRRLLKKLGKGMVGRG